MKRILPLCHPDVHGYTYHAFPLSILLTRQESRTWFYNQYIQLMSGTNEDFRYFTDFYTPTVENTSLVYSPLLVTQSSYRHQVDGYWKIIEYIVMNIEKGYYVYLFVDEFYIPGRTLYNSTHVTHDILIHGYDHENRLLYVSGFNKSVVYGQWTIPYDDLVKGYHMADISGFKNMIVRMKYNDLFQDFNSLFPIYESITDFLQSRNSSERFREVCPPLDTDYVFGLNIYENLISYLAEVLLGNYTLNVMPFHIIFEHKRVMCDRLRFLMEKYNIDLEQPLLGYTDMEENSLKLRTSCIRYSFRPENHLISKMRGILEKILQNERVYMKEIVNQLENIM